jgi:hypothetical protein
MTQRWSHERLIALVDEDLTEDFFRAVGTIGRLAGFTV